jgi:hypothetical protein
MSTRTDLWALKNSYELSWLPCQRCRTVESNFSNRKVSSNGTIRSTQVIRSNRTIRSDRIIRSNRIMRSTGTTRSTQIRNLIPVGLSNDQIYSKLRSTRKIGSTTMTAFPVGCSRGQGTVGAGAAVVARAQSGARHRRVYPLCVCACGGDVFSSS